MALKARAHNLGITKRIHHWTEAEISRLRKLFATSTIRQLMIAFPGLRKRQIKDKASSLRLRKKRRPYPPAGIPVIDQIKARAFALNLTMLDVDEMVHTRSYFQHSGKRGRRPRQVNGHAVCLAIAAFDGDVRAIWRDE